MRLLERYAAAIDARGLCPHMRDGGDLGTVIVVGEPHPSLEVACDAIARTDAAVVHVVYPMAPRDAEGARRFERFCNDVATRVRARGSVHAAFHPAMAGSRDDADRRIGLVRRAPDPFMQLVPPVARTSIARPSFDLDMLLAELDELRVQRLELGGI